MLDPALSGLDQSRRTLKRPRLLWRTCGCGQPVRHGSDERKVVGAQLPHLTAGPHHQAKCERCSRSTPVSCSTWLGSRRHPEWRQNEDERRRSTAVIPASLEERTWAHSQGWLLGRKERRVPVSRQARPHGGSETDVLRGGLEGDRRRRLLDAGVGKTTHLSLESYRWETGGHLE
jgi:hypothetical protein